MSQATFLRAIEIWVPTADRTKLTLKRGHYGELDTFERLSRGMRFAYDEGLPGRCWAQGQPIMLKDLANSYFKRGDAAMTEGLTCAVAVPTFAGPDLKAVTVLFCGDNAHHVGALELWHAAPGEPQMSLADGYFGSAEKFEFTSRSTQFSRKSGLPGMVWDSGFPLILDDLGRGEQFLRRASAEKVGIHRGVGLPCPVRGQGDWVLAMLSARNSPIARRFELWLPDLESGMFRYSEGFCESGADLAEAYFTVHMPLDVGPMGEARMSGIPVIATGGDMPAGAAQMTDASILVWPIFAQGSVSANLVAYL